ncbi:MAG: hypothetical protein ACOYYS_28260 [Chloroflexota bacterium]
MLVLAACVTGPSTSFPTPYPTEYLPTVIAMTAAILQTPTSPVTQPSDVLPVLAETTGGLSAAATLTPEPVHTPTEDAPPTPSSRPSEAALPTATRRPTRTPTITTTPEIPIAAIQIFAPGPMSKLLSPLRLFTYIKPGPTYDVTIELLGEDGRLLMRKMYPFTEEDVGPVISILEELEFEVPAVAEKARLVISTDDDFGRIVSLASVDVLLLSVGDADINPYGDLLETILIAQPAPSSLIQGGAITVVGQARLERGEVLIELTDAQGKLVGYQFAPVNAALGQSAGYGRFSIEVPYLVDSPTWVRLSVSQNGERPNSLTHLSSIEVLVSP